jgi:hypothetical protein
MWDTTYKCELEMYPDALLFDHPSTWRTLCVVPVAKIPASMEWFDKVKKVGPERHFRVKATPDAGIWRVSVEPKGAYWEVTSASAAGFAFLHDGLVVGYIRFAGQIQHETVAVQWSSDGLFDLADITADLPEGW